MEYGYLESIEMILDNIRSYIVSELEERHYSKEKINKVEECLASMNMDIIDIVEYSEVYISNQDEWNIANGYLELLDKGIEPENITIHYSYSKGFTFNY